MLKSVSCCKRQHTGFKKHAFKNTMRKHFKSQQSSCEFWPGFTTASTGKRNACNGWFFFPSRPSLQNIIIVPGKISRQASFQQSTKIHLNSNCAIKHLFRTESHFLILYTAAIHKQHNLGKKTYITEHAIFILF